MKEGGRLATTTLKVTVTILQPSDNFNVTTIVQASAFTKSLGVIIILFPDYVMKSAREVAVITTIDPSGSIAEGSEYVSELPTLTC